MQVLVVPGIPADLGRPHQAWIHAVSRLIKPFRKSEVAFIVPVYKGNALGSSYYD